ncbi:tripeptide aminopeptidase [Lachnospiraceae bacterium KM106-2]|nr:tripeptide aminopeptidase [Lachnospiraceae bacterium KM106-2]
MKAYERLLRYVKVYTTSDPSSTTVPTTKRQFDLAHMLVEELQSMGLKDARVDDKCYVYATLPATTGLEEKPKIGFIAHMDTAPDFNGENVNPQIIRNYDGSDVPLGTSGLVLHSHDFHHLPTLKGRTLITTDGTSLLGADDKAGIAEILTAVETIMEEKIPHGTICIGFTPDEEVGAGADYFDIKGFGADYAYTLDGEVEGEIVYENFNASAADFEIKGVNIHPGSAKDIMVNAALVATEIVGMLPSNETPAHTENYEGFYHLCDMKGDVESAKLEFIVRDHSTESFHHREEVLRDIARRMNDKYGEGTVNLTIKEQYLNMDEKIKPHMHLIDNAKKVMKELGVTPSVSPIRGGTDGARLSYMGLPCPNLGTAGHGYHGPYEHITAEGMDICVNIVVGIVKEYAK